MALGLLKTEANALDRLSLHLSEMGGLVEHQLSCAISAFDKRDPALAQSVIDSDRDVDACEAQIDNLVMELLESGKLSSENIRAVMTTIRIANVLERIGDLSKNIAKRSLVTSREDAAAAVTTVVRMGRIALRQLHDVLDAARDKNVEAAIAVWNGDDEIDELYNSIFREMLMIMTRDPSLVNACTHLAFAAKNFERIGDHATNIAERVHYSATGEKIGSQRPKNDQTSMMVFAQDIAPNAK